MSRGSIAAVLAAVAIGFVTVLLLLPYGNREDPGLSYDTPYYVWRTRAVTSDGVNVLTTIPTGAVPERPGVPVLGSLLGAVTGTDALTFTVVLRAIAAVAIGLAAGAMAVEALREPRWAFAAFVVGLGASAAVVGTAVGSLDQLLADVLLVAAAAIAPLVAAGRKGTLALGVLFAAAAATHWVFAGLFLLLLAGVALALLPGSLTSHRAGAAWTATPSGRLLRAALVAVAAAAVTLADPPRPPPSAASRDRRPGEPASPRRVRTRPRPPARGARVRPHVPALRRLPSSRAHAPGSVGGHRSPRDARLGRPPDADQALPGGSVRARDPRPRDPLPRDDREGGRVPPGPGGSRPRRRGARRRTLLGERVVRVSSFDEAAAASITERLTQARTAGRYLDGVSRAGRPVIFVTEGNPRLLDRVVRSAVPPDLIADTWVFVGRPSDLAAAGPVDDPSRPRLTEIAQKWWAAAWPDPSQVFARDPLVIRIGPAGRTDGASEEGAVELAPGVEVVHGPPPAASFAPPAPFRATWTELLVATGLALVVLIVVGGGWTLSMLEVSRLAAFGLAPAFGIAALILGGTVASRLGLSLARPGGSLIVLAIGGVGWLVFALARTVSAGRTSAGAQGSPVG